MSDLRWVQSAPRRPNRCAAIPFIGQTHPKGFFDTGTEFFGERVYISVVAAQEMARKLGWSAPEVTRALAEQVDRLERELALEREKLTTANQTLDAIDTLESVDFRARKKPAARKKQTEEVA